MIPLIAPAAAREGASLLKASYPSHPRTLSISTSDPSHHVPLGHYRYRLTSGFELRHGKAPTFSRVVQERLPAQTALSNCVIEKHIYLAQTEPRPGLDDPPHGTI